MGTLDTQGQLTSRIGHHSYAYIHSVEMGSSLCSVMIVMGTVARTTACLLNWVFPLTFRSTITLSIMHLCRYVNSAYTTTTQLDIDIFLYQAGLGFFFFVSAKITKRRVNDFINKNHGFKRKTVVKFRFLPSLVVPKPKYDKF